MNTEVRTAEEVILTALRDEVRTHLARCTEDQQKFFARMYPEGIDRMGQFNLSNALSQIRFTIKKNQAAQLEATAR